MPRDELPVYEAIDDSPHPRTYRIPYQHGWLLEFRKLRGGIGRWVVYAKDGALYLDTGERAYCLSDGEAAVRVRRIGCLVRVQLVVKSPGESRRFWIRFPFSRLVFWDPAADAKECEPLYDIFVELASAEGKALWVRRWTSGVAHRSTALSRR